MAGEEYPSLVPSVSWEECIGKRMADMEKQIADQKVEISDQKDLILGVL